METAIEPGQPQRLRTDVFLTFGAKVVVLALNSVATIVVARALGPGGRGVFYVALGLTLILSQIGTIGLGVANAYVAAQAHASARRLTWISLFAAASVGSVLLLAGFGIHELFPDALPNLSATELWLALAAVPASLAAVYLQAILLGLGRMIPYNAVEVAQAIGTLAGLLIGFGLLGFDVTGGLAVMVAGFYCAAGAYAAILLVVSPPSARNEGSVGLLRRMVVFSLKTYVASLAMYLLLRLDTLLVNAYLGKEEAGYYSAATAIADALMVLPIVIGLNLLPRVARDGGWKPTAEIFSGVALLYGLVCLVSVPLARPGIELLFGEDFQPAVSLYYWLAPGVFCLGMISILAHHFAGRGMPLSAVLIWLPGLALNIGLNVAFLDSEGTYFASLASSIGYAVVLLLAVWLFAREAGSAAPLRPSVPRAVRLIRVALSRG
jgi:O-antigen/teichoic acid export membrane protein